MKIINTLSDDVVLQIDGWLYRYVKAKDSTYIEYAYDKAPGRKLKRFVPQFTKTVLKVYNVPAPKRGTVYVVNEQVKQLFSNRRDFVVLYRPRWDGIYRAFHSFGVLSN